MSPKGKSSKPSKPSTSKKHNGLFQIEEKYNEKGSDNEHSSNSNSDSENGQLPKSKPNHTQMTNEDIIKAVIRKEIDYLIAIYKKEKQIKDDTIIKAVIIKEILYLFAEYQAMKKKGLKQIKSIPLGLNDNQNSPVIDIPLGYDIQCEEPVSGNASGNENNGITIPCKHANEKQKKYQEDVNAYDSANNSCSTNYYSHNNKSNLITAENTEMYNTEDNAKVSKKILDLPKAFEKRNSIPIIYPPDEFRNCDTCCSIM